jgi:protein subunit release factor B
MDRFEETMASSTDVTMVSDQADAVREVHSVRKQSLESSQQFMTQKTEEKNRQEKDKDKRFESEKGLEEQTEKRLGGDDEDAKKGRNRKQSSEPSGSWEGLLIDIKV